MITGSLDARKLLITSVFSKSTDLLYVLSEETTVTARGRGAHCGEPLVGFGNRQQSLPRFLSEHFQLCDPLLKSRAAAELFSLSGTRWHGDWASRPLRARMWLYLGFTKWIQQQFVNTVHLQMVER